MMLRYERRDVMLCQLDRASTALAAPGQWLGTQQVPSKMKPEETRVAGRVLYGLVWLKSAD